MFRLAILFLALAPISLFAGEVNYMPAELGRTLFAVFFVVGATCFSLGFVTQEDVPKDPPPYNADDNPPDRNKENSRRSA